MLADTPTKMVGIANGFIPGWEEIRNRSIQLTQMQACQKRILQLNRAPDLDHFIDWIADMDRHKRRCKLTDEILYFIDQMAT